MEPYKLTFDQYQQGLREGKLLGLKCLSCGIYLFPPRGVCEGCGGHDMEVVELKGEGTLRTFTVIRVAPEGMKAPYIVAMVELNEGPWAVGNLVNLDPNDADIGLMGKKVKLESQTLDAPTGSDDPPVHVLTATLI